MTLLEVVIGMVIFALVATGSMAAILHSRRMTEASIRQITAQITAHGYLEQLKGINFKLLDTSPVKLRFGNGDFEDDELILSPLPRTSDGGIANVRKLDVNNTPENVEDDLELSVVVYVEPVRESTNSRGPARAIFIRYTWEEFSTSGMREKTADVSCIRSDML